MKRILLPLLAFLLFNVNAYSQKLDSVLWSATIKTEGCVTSVKESFIVVEDEFVRILIFPCLDLPSWSCHIYSKVDGIVKVKWSEAVMNNGRLIPYPTKANTVPADDIIYDRQSYILRPIESESDIRYPETYYSQYKEAVKMVKKSKAPVLFNFLLVIPIEINGALKHYKIYPTATFYGQFKRKK